jgi:hypothetical protein
VRQGVPAAEIPARRNISERKLNLSVCQVEGIYGFRDRGIQFGLDRYGASL